MKNSDPFNHYFNKIRRLFESKDDDMEDEDPGDPGDVDPDFEPGKTNFPRGQGHPNVDARYKKVVHIDHITIPDKMRDDYNNKYSKTVVNYIRKQLPWIFTTSSYYADGLRGTSDVDEMYRIVKDAYDRYRHWINDTGESSPQDPEHWAVEREKSKKIKAQHPNIDEDFKKFDKFMEDFIWSEAPDNPDNKQNYPLYVSLYDITRNLGGHEEGGWWYVHHSAVKSIEAKSPEQAEKIAKMLYNKIDSLNLDGKPIIILEKEKGSENTKEAPTYS